jgi:hypothetical protein
LYTVGYRHLEFSKEVQAGNINGKVIHIGWYLEPRDKLRTAETNEKWEKKKPRLSPVSH